MSYVDYFTNNDFLSELPEKKSDGSTKEIYECIKSLTGVPMAALIYRHLATQSGALDWAWTAVRSAMENGYIQDTAWSVAEKVSAIDVAPLAFSVLETAGVNAAEIEQIAAVLSAYNRANPVNLLVVTSLIRRIEDAEKVTDFTLPPRKWTPPEAIPALPPMVSIDAIQGHVGRILVSLATASKKSDGLVVPSLYRHFAHLPGFLTLVADIVLPRYTDGSIALRARELQDNFAGPARELSRIEISAKAPDPSILAVLKRFEQIIPEMIVVGRLLQGAIPPETR